MTGYGWDHGKAIFYTMYEFPENRGINFRNAPKVFEPCKNGVKLIDGILYREGAHGFIYLGVGSDWIKSSMSVKEFDCSGEYN